MLFSCLVHRQTAPASNVRLRQGSVPGVLDLQRLIEAAWDSGLSVEAKKELGSIVLTRKYIGTPEVCFAQHTESTNQFTTH